MDALAKQIANQIKKYYPTEEEQLQVANKVLGELRQQTHIQKIHGGGMSELEACKAIGLAWNGQNARGADAHDSFGRAVELKTFSLKSTAKACNVNYVFPKNVADLPHYYATSPAYAGGHYWVAMNGHNTKVRWWFHITQANFAEIVRFHQQANPGKDKANFGSTLCKTCKKCPRFQRLVGIPHVCVPDPVATTTTAKLNTTFAYA